MNLIRNIALLTLAASAASFVTGCHSTPESDFAAPAVMRPISVSVSTQAAEGTEPALVRDIVVAASQNLTRRGFRLAATETPDVAVLLGVSQKEYNRAGDFIAYDGRIDARVFLPADGARIIDEAAFTARGRALGEAAATSKLSSELATQIDAWLTKTISLENLQASGLTLNVIVAP